MSVVHWGEFLALCLVAIALGMDAFSVSIGLGMRGLRLRQVMQISMLIGLFHMIMPLLGILIGRYLSSFLGSLTVTIGGSLLILFGIHMMYSSMFGKEKDSWVSSTGWGLILFSIGVSIDGFSVGLSLGMFAVNTGLTIILFGLFGLGMTAIGLLLGRKLGGWIGEYGEIVGGMILLAFGIKFLL